MSYRPRDRLAEEGIGHATSTDGIHWTEQPPVIGRGEPGSWDDAAIYTGSAIEVAGKYYMLYIGLTNADHLQRVGLLTSDDMFRWERFAGDPVIEPDPRWYENPQAPAPDGRVEFSETSRQTLDL